jgi:hypothetical protein
MIGNISIREKPNKMPERRYMTPMVQQFPRKHLKCVKYATDGVWCRKVPRGKIRNGLRNGKAWGIRLLPIHLQSGKLSNSPLIMYNTNQIELISFLFKNKPQRFPVHPIILRIEARKIKFCEISTRIGFCQVIQ